MSSKKKDTDPRVAVKDTIITRTKSAQLKRQLGEKGYNKNAECRKNFTQPLTKSPSPSKISKISKSCRGRKRKNKTKVETEVPEKLYCLPKTPERKVIHVEENKEYYPNMLKRPFKVKKITLKPQNELKLIGDIKSINKRKLQIPRKDIKYPAYKSTYAEMDLEHHTSELTIEEIIRLTEDNESLTDEDLLEIMTCPSPVWWEELPGPGYFEDPMFTNPLIDVHHTRSNTPKLPELDNISSLNTAETESVNGVLEIPKEKKIDKKFMTKRTKLESLLDCLKNKLFDLSHVSDRRFAGDEKELKIRNKVSQSSLISPLDKTYSDSAEENLSDMSLMDDDILKTLESIHIPIENEVSLHEKQIDPETREVNNITEEISNEKYSDKLNIISKPVTDNISLDASQDISELEKYQDIGASSTCSESSFLGFANDSYKDSNGVDDDVTLNEEEDLRNKSPFLYFENEVAVPDIPTVLPPLKRIPKTIDNELLSPTSEDTIDTSSRVSDTISDTNFQFITDEEDFCISNYKNCVKYVNIRKDLDDQQTKSAESKTEYITVYQIISNDDNNKVENGDCHNKSTSNEMYDKTCINDRINADKGKLNNFYKKCKTYSIKKPKLQKAPNFSQAKLNVDDMKKKFIGITKADEDVTVCNSCDDKEATVVSDNTKVKYCKKCSSIYDTEICLYCVENYKGSCVPSSESCRKFFVCNLCDFRAKNEDTLEAHFRKHLSGDGESTDLSQSQLVDVGDKDGLLFSDTFFVESVKERHFKY